MNLARQMAAAGQMATAAFDEEDVRSLRPVNPFSFRAKIVPIADISLNTELGLDPRATDIFYVRDKSVVARVAAGDQWSALGARFLVLPANAPDNPASLHAEFHCQRLVDGVDS